MQIFDTLVQVVKLGDLIRKGHLCKVCDMCGKIMKTEMSTAPLNCLLVRRCQACRQLDLNDLGCQACRQLDLSDLGCQACRQLDLSDLGCSIAADGSNGELHGFALALLAL
eukprot:122477-Pelagomonas_calceolata.AAC.11